MQSTPKTSWETLRQKLAGDLFTDAKMRKLYATDASVYRELPQAVAYPRNVGDLQDLVAFANKEGTSLIPRTAGTSLAGQCVGSGIVVDVSRYMNKILEYDLESGWVKVEPGVIRNELNDFLKPHGWFFGPNTSTANRCMIGGMVGNNSSGTTSIKYGVTRDHVLALETVLSDGSLATFGEERTAQTGFAQTLSQKMEDLLKVPNAREEIESSFPKKEIHRRNTGYALDVLLDQERLDLSKLLAGSEGTLALTHTITLSLSPLPPKEVAVVCAHFPSIGSCMNAVQIAMDAEPYACELMDKIILDCTKENIEQRKNRFFVEGDPAAVLAIELRDDTRSGVEKQVADLVSKLTSSGLGYAFPAVYGKDCDRVWSLRAAGLGLLSNVPGDAKPIACIEDTAVTLEDLPAYIQEFEENMRQFEQEAVYYAHAGAGELHLRPILNLKSKEDRDKFRQICEASARLVKKYKGSLSGEHGDGRVRAEFIPLMVGEANYERFVKVKQIWDPQNIFNPGKIVHAKPIDEDLRYVEDQRDPDLETFLDFGEEGLLRAAEKCNGSADCRSLKGSMCPSYQATREEKDTTRARANMLREAITQDGPQEWANEDLKDVLDLCVSCKACKSACPSNVDMAAMKGEFLYQYHRSNGIDRRTKMMAKMPETARKILPMAGFVNGMMQAPILGGLVKNWMGIAQKRTLPTFNRTTFRKWQADQAPGKGGQGTVYLFADEFVNYQELELGQSTYALLEGLGYEVRIVPHAPSGRTYISKGLLEEARACASENVEVFAPLISEENPLVGIEPSAILSFRDEYPSLLKGSKGHQAKALAGNCLTLEEFLAQEAEKRDFSSYFDAVEREILVHVHCHQRALSRVDASVKALSLASGHSVEVINSGCCGMAGSFGYEAEHYDASMAMGELRLFPAVRAAKKNTIIVASGTSCRHQIEDGTKQKAMHVASVLCQALQR